MKFAWKKLLWIGVIVVTGLVSLNLSMRTYLSSLNRQEAFIAQAQPEELTSGTNPTTLKFPKDGEVRIYYWRFDSWTNRKFELTYQETPNVFEISTGNYKDTGINIKAQESLTEKISAKVNDVYQPDFNWQTPINDGKQCGVSGLADPPVNIEAYVKEVNDNGEPIVSTQCWSDWDTAGEPASDYNDFLVIFSYKPTPSSNKAYFQIRKFNDLNGDGDKDSNEGSPNKTWSFQYSINDGDWKAINTATASGLSAKTTMNKGTKVEVEEFTKSGWKITTPKNQTQTLSQAGHTYTFDFGNQRISASPSPEPGSSPSPSPSPGANQPTFVIEKFLDANKNGVRETGEGSTNRAWEFTYQVNGGQEESYTIEPNGDAGDTITVNIGDRVKIQELGQEGWLNTTGTVVEQTLNQSKNYKFYFGNYPVNGINGASPTPNFPPSQPSTGAPTWLSVGSAGLGATLLLVKLLFGF
ncbi:MAG: hypothetical protein NTZ93_03845 [Candidatus Beckwithbacteria bacterium]|nr:hypothetical protein [Candidatus Beckwithbacteria bacterium]